MPLSDTKQKILDASLQLFNENGISNTRLQQIADETGISVGNLAYHFANKDLITESLIENVIASLRDLLRKYGRYDTLHDLNFFFQEYYRISAQYVFFNFDVLEIKRNFPPSYEMLQPLLHKIKLQLERHLDLCLQQRLLKNEANIRQIAANIWLFMFFLPLEGQINGRKITITENLFRLRLWGQILPWFTEKGILQYGSSVAPELS